MFAVIFQFFFHFEFFGKKTAQKWECYINDKKTGFFEPKNTKSAYTLLACMLLWLAKKCKRFWAYLLYGGTPLFLCPNELRRSRTMNESFDLHSLCKALPIISSLLKEMVEERNDEVSVIKAKIDAITAGEETADEIELATFGNHLLL